MSVRGNCATTGEPDAAAAGQAASVDVLSRPSGERFQLRDLGGRASLDRKWVAVAWDEGYAHHISELLPYPAGPATPPPAGCAPTSEEPT